MQNEENHQHPTRRSFQATAIQLLGAAIAAVVAVPASLYLLMKPKTSGAAGLVEVADLAQLDPGVPQEVVYYRTRVDGWKEIKEKTTAWVVKRGEDEAVAFSPQCPHLGCIYHWEYENSTFECPCHASSFAVDGAVLDGPAPRGLDKLVTRIEGGMLLVGGVDLNAENIPDGSSRDSSKDAEV